MFMKGTSTRFAGGIGKSLLGMLILNSFAFSATVNAADYDYVIVGAGLGGGTLAARLAEKKNSTGNYNRVLLLEAGKDLPEDKYYAQIPSLNPQASERPGLSWKFMVEHYADPVRATRDRKRCPAHPSCEPGDVGIFYPRGATVGGSGVVNAMISVLPHNDDWNRMATALNDPSWSAANMRSYFTKLENNLYPLNIFNPNHGRSGWLPISLPLSSVSLLNAGFLLDFTSIIIDASVGLGMGPLPIADIVQDTNDANPADDGFYLIPSAIDGNGRRGSVRDRIYSVANDPRYSLTLKTGALVTKVLFDDAGGQPTKAIGVEYREGTDLYSASRRFKTSNPFVTRQATVDKEVVLAAGAFNTPQLLMLSGIGDPAQLSQTNVNIPVRVDLPGVGKHLQDRYEIPVIFAREEGKDFGTFKLTTPKDFTALEDCAFNPSVPDGCFLEWLLNGTGVYAQSGGLVSVIRRSANASTLDPDLFIFALGATFEGYFPNYSAQSFTKQNQFTWAILKGHNNNEGYVRLRSNNPADRPVINFNYFGGPTAAQTYANLAPEHKRDVDSVVEAIRLVRKMRPKDSSIPLELFYEVSPGKDVDTDAELRNFVMNEVWGHHACGTARMGADRFAQGGSVVDTRFRVFGTQNLRVVDASIWPKIPGFFIALPTMMLGEKAADVISADNR
jgi:choline dehydrogenase